MCLKEEWIPIIPEQQNSQASQASGSKSNAVEELKNPFSRPFFIVFVQVNGSNYMPDISRWHFKTQMKILWL